MERVDLLRNVFMFYLNLNLIYTNQKQQIANNSKQIQEMLKKFNILKDNFFIIYEY